MFRKTAHYFGIVCAVAAAMACGLTNRNNNKGSNGGGTPPDGASGNAGSFVGAGSEASSSGGDTSIAGSGGELASAGQAGSAGAPSAPGCGPDGLMCASGELCVFGADELPAIAGYHCAAIPAACAANPTCACVGEELCDSHSCQDVSPDNTALRGAQIYCSCPAC